MVQKSGESVIQDIGLNRAIPLTHNSKILDSQDIILKELNEKEFNIDSVYFNTDENNNSYPAVFLKKVHNFDEVNLKDIAETHRKIWNYNQVIFFYVYSDYEIRIYNCHKKPVLNNKCYIELENDLEQLEIEKYEFSDKQQLEELKMLFSRISIDTGIIWTLKQAQFVREKINQQHRVDQFLVSSLVNTANQLEEQGLKIDFIHKIMLRSLFLLYLEDRGATSKKFYNQFKKGATSYFDILEDVNATYQLFKCLTECFNGNVFTVEEDEEISVSQLKLIQKCFTSGNDNSTQLELSNDWRLFDFSIIQIELLSEIYENFLFKTDPELKKQTGTYYTPPALVEFMLKDKLPITKEHKNYNTKILDMSCGSGIFLVQSFKRLVKRYENHHGEKLTDFSKLKKLLTDNIFGIELHPQAIKITAFSLYLALVDNLDPKTLWQDRKHRLPNLVNNPNDKSLKEQGRNLFCRDTISDLSSISELNNFQLIIGNPPFGTGVLPKSVSDYCKRKGFAKEMVIPFLHKATEFAPEGQIALIFNTKVLTNTSSTYGTFRKWLFNECYVEKVFNFSIFRNPPEAYGGQLFGNATNPISIVYYQKEIPDNLNNTITYYAPKTYIKSNMLDGLCMDFTDVKYLPREECQKANTKIWKIAMWGSFGDWKLIKNIISRSITLKDYFQNDDNKWETPRVGLHGEKKKLNFTPDKILDTKLIEKYYTPKFASKKNLKSFRNIDKKIFTPPFVIMKKGQHNKQLTASYIDYDTYCTTACYIFNGNISIDIKKTLVAIFNSKLTTYLFFLTSSSWGIEREQIFLEEILESPAILPLLHKSSINKIVNLFDRIILEKQKSELFENKNINSMEDEIEDLITMDILKFHENDKIFVDDNLRYNLDLFYNQEKSVALKPVLEQQIKNYADIVNKKLNEFIDSEDLYANITIYKIDINNPLAMIKISHEKDRKEIKKSNEDINEELKKLDQYFWEKESENIYFRKKLNYTKENETFIIRPNQQRFWTKSMALENSSELINEFLLGLHDYD